MKTRMFAIALASLAVVLMQVSCKKDKGNAEPSGPTRVITLELEYESATGMSGGLQYTFRLTFESLGNVKEYGIVYVPWIGEKSEKTPTYDGATSVLFPFSEKAGPAGVIQQQKHTFRFSDFNDVNYRAYAVLNDGTIVYGEILHIGFS